MNALRLSLAASALALVGCAQTARVVFTAPVGPLQPGQQVESPDVRPLTSAATTDRRGHLIVYSAWDRLDTLDAEHRKHTPYRVHSNATDETLFVANHAGAFEEEPESIVLAPGHYDLEADATDSGLLTVPIVIEPGETTVVYLDGTTQPVLQDASDPSWIKEPNGFIVGRKGENSAPAGSSSPDSHF